MGVCHHRWSAKEIAPHLTVPDRMAIIATKTNEEIVLSGR